MITRLLAAAVLAAFTNSPAFAQDLALKTISEGGGYLYSQALAFSPDGRLLASGNGDKTTVTLRNAHTAAEIRTFKPDDTWGNYVYCVAFSPDGQTLAAGVYDETVKLWNPRTGADIQTLKPHDGQVKCLAFSPDGKMLVVGTVNEAITFWDLSTGTEIRTIRGHDNADINCVAFSPDGKILASGKSDGELTLWCPSTGAEIGKLQKKGPHQNLWALEGCFLGARPPDPGGFIAWRPIPESGKRESGTTKAAPSPVLAPGTALGLLPSRALSSVQAMSHCSKVERDKQYHPARKKSASCGISGKDGFAQTRLPRITTGCN